MCEVVFGEFLKEIKKNFFSVKFVEMVNILVIYCQIMDDFIQLIVMCWMWEFIQLVGCVMLFYFFGILIVVLFCLVYDDCKKSIKEVVNVCNQSLMKLVIFEDDELDELRFGQRQVEFVFDDVLIKQEGIVSGGLDGFCDFSFSSSISVFIVVSIERVLVIFYFDGIVQVLNCYFSDMVIGMMIRIVVFKWFYYFYIKIFWKMFWYMDSFFFILLQMLLDELDEVILKDLEVLVEIVFFFVGQMDDLGFFDGFDFWVSYLEFQVFIFGRVGLLNIFGIKGLECFFFIFIMNFYFYKFMINFFKRFSSEWKFLEVRGFFIIRQLCFLLNVENIFYLMVDILLWEEDFKFVLIMVYVFNIILLIFMEFFQLRNQLKDLKILESQNLFCCLYCFWCYNLVIMVFFCFFIQNYWYVYDFIQKFGDLEVIVDFFVEVDKLVQLIECFIFIYLCLQLLDVKNNFYLIKVFYGLFMFLLQSSVFQLFLYWFQCVFNFELLQIE